MRRARFGLSPPQASRARPRREGIVPMINIVFLLLVFFMLTATIAPPDPFELDLPQAAAPDPAAPRQLVLAVARDGTLAHDGAEGAAALAALAAALRPGDGVLLRADAALDGAAFAALLAELAALGVAEVALALRDDGGAR